MDQEQTLSAQSPETNFHFNPPNPLINEIFNQSQADLADKGLTSEDFNDWINTNIVVEQVNGCDVVFMNHDHGDDRDFGTVHEADTKGRPTSEKTAKDIQNARCLQVFTQAFVQKDKNRYVVREYFSPELKAATRSSPIFKLFPRLLKRLKVRETRARMFGFNNLNRLCQKNNITIITPDIANRPAYQIQREFIRYGSPTVIFSLFLATAGSHAAQHERIPTEIINTLALPTLYSLLNLIEAGDRKFSWGMYNAQKMSSAEQNISSRLHLSHEDARRLLMANHINAVTKELSQDQSLEETPKPAFLFPLPPAHKLRVLHYLHNKRPIKSSLYSHMPFIDTKPRFWKFNHQSHSWEKHASLQTTTSTINT